MSDQNTTWYIRLMEVVTGPLKKISDYATGTNKRISDLSNTTKQFTARTNVLGRDFKRNLSGLNTLLDDLKRRQAESFNTKHIQAYQKMIHKTEGEIKKLNAAINPPATGWNKWKADLKSAADEIPGVGRALNLLKNPISLIAGAALAIGTYSTKLALNFETDMAKVNATAQLAGREFQKLDERLTEIGSHSGGQFERLPSTYEKILSVTGKVNQSLELTELAVKAAKAGFTDLDTVGNALARTMNVIEDKTVSAAGVLDMLMMAKNVGAGEFEDFARYIPTLIAGAQPAGYNHKDAIGMFSALSKSFEGSLASTYTQNLFTAFKKTDIVYALEKAGVQVFKNGFRRPIKDVLLDLAELKKKMSPELFTNFMDAIKLKDVQAATAIGAITSNVDALKEVFDGLNKSIGETDRALAATEHTARGWAEIGDEIKAMAKAIGDYLLPVIDNLVHGLYESAKALKKLFNGELIGNLFKKSSWRDQTDEDIIKEARVKRLREIAERRTRDYYKIPEGQPFTQRKHWAFFQSIYNQNMAKNDAIDAAKKNDKNKIVSEKEEARGIKGKKLFDASKGIHMAQEQMADNKKDAKEKGHGSGGNKGPTTLNMYLTVNQHFTTSKDDDQQIKRKATDLIVDAARDAMVTIGL